MNSKLSLRFSLESILNKANWDFEDFQSLLGRWMTQKFNKPIRDCDLEVPNKSSAFCSKSCEVIGLPLAYPSRYLVTEVYSLGSSAYLANVCLSISPLRGPFWVIALSRRMSNGAFSITLIPAASNGSMLLVQHWAMSIMASSDSYLCIWIYDADHLYRMARSSAPEVYPELFGPWTNPSISYRWVDNGKFRNVL